MTSRIPLRWIVLTVFILSSSLNYLDRQILATLAPVLRAEFHLSNQDYGMILAVFSIVYTLSAPLSGLWIDRVGLNRGISICVGLWSLAGTLTGTVRSYAGLLWTRGALGLFEAGGVPATGKVLRLYLAPRERAFGNAISQLGLSVGAMAAPVVATWFAVTIGWRFAFLITGLAGFLWIPLWRWTARRLPPDADTAGPPGPSAARQMLRDRQLWGLILANVLGMTAYTLWTNWTTVFLVQQHRLTLQQAMWYAWIPPLAFNTGGLLGGWLSWRWIARGAAPNAARRRICYLSAVAMLVTALVPLAPAAGLATAIICLSAFFSSAFSVNLYSIPLDAFPAASAAFGVSCLTGAYGAMQTVFSPVVGRLLDHYGFGPVCLLSAVLPLAGAGILHWTRREA